MLDRTADPFDPNNWDAIFAQHDAHEYRVYLDDRGDLYAIVDREDYEWAIKHRWCAKKELNGTFYARRAVGENANGQRLRTFSLYLHIEIHKRTKKRRPTRFHVLVDHRNGRSLDCRRKNLRWVTPSMNQRNRWGHAPRDLVDDHAGGSDAPAP
jgi:hypothetical protein